MESIGRSLLRARLAEEVIHPIDEKGVFGMTGKGEASPHGEEGENGDQAPSGEKLAKMDNILAAKWEGIHSGE